MPFTERPPSPPAEPPRRPALAAVPVAHVSDAARTAEAAAATWIAIEAALAPVIGRGGVVALHRRCLHVARRAHPWLGEVHEQERPSGDHDYISLRSVLARQTAAEAGAACAALLKALNDTVAQLIGPALTDRLLRHVAGTGVAADAAPPP